MRTGFVVVSILILVLLCVSCGGESHEAVQSGAPEIPLRKLCVTDSFGEEIGDSLRMIGSIDDFCFHPDGSVLILDRAAMYLRVIPLEGDPYLIGRGGEGPGEYLFPHSICAFSDERILVADEMKKEVMIFDTAGEYLGDYFRTDRYVPYRMFPVDSSSIVGTTMTLDMGDPICFSFYAGRFDTDSIPSVVYHNIQWEWPAPEMYTDVELFNFAAEPGGNVYLTDDVTSYSVSVFSPEGDELYTISRQDVERLPKTDEEIEEEIVFFESWAYSDQAYTGGYQPAPFYQIISIAGVDADGNLWIERYDKESGHHFDVWDASGALAYTAVLVEYGDVEMLFSVDQYGILGAVIDADHYPQILTLELEMTAEADLE